MNNDSYSFTLKLKPVNSTMEIGTKAIVISKVKAERRRVFVGVHSHKIILLNH